MRQYPAVTCGLPVTDFQTPMSKSDQERLIVVPWRWLVRLLIGLVVLPVAGATLISCFATNFWFADLFAHFRVQYCIVLMPAVLVLLLLRFWKLLLLCLVCLAINVMPIWPYLVPLRNQALADAPEHVYRILSLNLLTSNQEYESVRKLILETRPDFVCLLETDSRWEQALERLAADYPHSHFEPHPGNFGIAFLSRQPWQQLEVDSENPLGLPSLIIDLKSRQGGRLQIVATHPIPPLGPWWTAARDEQLRQINSRVERRLPGSPGG